MSRELPARVRQVQLTIRLDDGSENVVRLLIAELDDSCEIAARLMVAKTMGTANTRVNF